MKFNISFFLKSLLIGFILLVIWLLPMLLILMNPEEYDYRLSGLTKSIMAKHWLGALYAYSIVVLFCASVFSETNFLKKRHPYLKTLIETLTIPFLAIIASYLYLAWVKPRLEGAFCIVWLASAGIYSVLIGLIFLIKNIIPSRNRKNNFSI